MTKRSLFIRFGLHKDREVLEKSKELYKGLVVPAHILSYSQDATIAAVNYINHDYFIDPMTYVLTSQTIKNYLTGPSEDNPNKAIGFKPSIKKLVENYGIYEHFVDNGFKAFQVSDATALMDIFVNKSILLQLNKIDDGFAPALKKYAKILQLTEKQHNPVFVTPPYFYFDQAINKQWQDVNLKYALETKNQLATIDSQMKVVPILATDSKSLSEELVTQYKDFGHIIIWLSDVDETRCTVGNALNTQATKLKKLSDFIKKSAEAGLLVSNLYGSYFSLMCSRRGLDSIANGIFYGEYKNYKQKVGGGGPSSRFYISGFHKFFSIPQTIQIFEKYPELLRYEPQATLDLIKNTPTNIAEFDSNIELAQVHFLEARKKELQHINDAENIEKLVEELDQVYKQYSPLPSSIVEGDSLAHLNTWAKALEGEAIN